LQKIRFDALDIKSWVLKRNQLRATELVETFIQSNLLQGQPPGVTWGQALNADHYNLDAENLVLHQRNLKIYLNREWLL